MSDLHGRTLLVTGANSGIGLVAARTFASRGAYVVLACRSRARAEPVLQEILAKGGAAEILELDLTSLASVRSAGATFLATGRPLHVLVNNAGIAGRGITQDGFELDFGVNHLGHFLLTHLLLPALAASGGGRVVNVSSAAHRLALGLDFTRLRERTRSLTGFREYRVSKLCNVLFTRELARRYSAVGLTAVSLHPGVVSTRIWRRIPWPLRPFVTRSMVSPEQGAETLIYCATEPDLENGAYFQSCAVRHHSLLGSDAGLAAELWRKSAEWTGIA